MRAALILFLGLLAGAAYAHPAPNSTLRLEFRAEAVHAEYWVPVSELAFARAADPAGEGFPAYLLRHFAVETPDGKAWRVSVERVREADYLEHAFVVAEIRLIPPAGATSSEFVLVDDTVTHEVRNHVLYVVARLGERAEILGALQYPAKRLAIAAAR
jgi:hypothetical protein